MDILRFVYRKANGEESVRVVTNWREEGNYFIGLCSSNNTVKTFLKPCVVQWLGGTEPAFISPPEPLPHIKKDSRQHTVCFTCFAKKDKPDFEKLAEQAGLLPVQGITKHLTFLCVGNYGNKAPTKMAEARCKGAYIIPADSFINLLNTGELPDYDQE